MKNRFPIEFFQELAKKNLLREDADPETTIPDGPECEETQDLMLSEKTYSDEATEVL